MPLELFSNNGSTTVSSGGTTAPAAGTSESWTVASSSSFPAASSSSTPKTVFRVIDPAQPTEWMQVTNVSGTTWTVTRGIEGTTTTHTAGFTVQQVVTAGWLNGQDTRLGITNVKQVFDAKGDGKTVQDGAMTSASATLTSATASFTAADVGKKILVSAATSTAMRHVTFIASVTNATTAVLKTAARVSNTGQTMIIDNSRTVTDTVTTNDSTTITSATAAFTSADVGKHVAITNAGRVALNTTIAAFTNSTTVTLSVAATRTCTATQVVYGSDDTTPFINAFTWAGTSTTPTSLYVPSGMYLVTPSHLGSSAMNIPANCRVFGDGWDSIIRSTGNEDSANRSWEMWGINTGSGGSADPTTNTANVVIEDLQFQGTTVEEGFLENGCNLLSLNACSAVVVRGCRFYNSRSDGIYLGSGTTGSAERHNEQIRIEDCTFDGVNCENRNGISIIDGTDVLVNGCTFQNLTRFDMPGAIDCEPNAFAYARIRGIKITNCHFTMIGGNQGVASIYTNYPQGSLTIPAQGWTFTNNTVYNVMTSTVGLFLQSPTFPDDTTPRHNVIVANNVFRGDAATSTGLNYPIDLEGIRGAEIHDNIIDWSNQSIIFGYNYKCLDINLSGNVFKDLGAAGGKAIEVVRCDRLTIDGNIFDHTSPTSSGGYITRFVNGGTTLTPSGLIVTPSTTGGTLGAATRSYRVSAYMDNSAETVACTAVTGVTTGTTASVALSWTAVYGAKGYNVYGRASGSELKMTPSGQTATTFTDTGAVTPSGALPSATSDRGGSSGVVFRNNTIRQGSANNTANISNVVANHTNVANSNVYQNNQVPSNAALAMGPFVDSSVVYTVSTSALTLDASLVPPGGTAVLTGSTTSAAGVLTVSNPVIGQIMTVEYVIPTTNFTYATASNMKFAGAAAATHTLTAGRRDIYTFRYDGTNWNELARSINVG